MKAPDTIEERPEDAPSRPAGARLPQIPGPGETALALWRWLRRMSTALALLFCLAAASVVATFVPQEPLIPTTVGQWREGVEGPGAAVAGVFDTLGLFDVYGTWWFLALTLLLFVSLTGCLIPRWRAFAQVVRRQPPRGRNLDRLSHRVVLRTGQDPDEALRAVRAVLARRRFRRTLREDGQVAAERGHWREGGSLVFHTSFYLLLVGVFVGQAFGFRGQINIPEGSSFADAYAIYDLAEAGRWWDLEDHRGFVVTLDRFDVAWHENFIPAEFTSTITISEDGAPVRTEQVVVNHPVRHQGMTIYQARWGWAPRIIVRAGDTVLYDEQLMLADQGGSVWTGVAKVAMGGAGPEGERGPQIALDVVFLPDAAVTDDGIPYSRSPEPENPRLIADLWVGDLGLERPVPARDFDREGGEAIGVPAIMAEGGAQEMGGGLVTVEFAELTRWSGFQVSHGPARPLLLAGSLLILVGLVPSLYSYRRRIWAEAKSDGDGAQVRLAGVALQRKSAFAAEFAAVAAAVRKALGAEENEG